MKKTSFLFLIISFIVLPLKAEYSTGRELLEAVVDNYEKSDTYSASAIVEFHLKAPAQNMMILEYDIDLKKPNKFLIESSAGPLGKNIISDGETMKITLPALNKYTKTQAPKDFMEILAPDFTSANQLGSERFILFTFFSKNNRYLNDDDIDIELKSRETTEEGITDRILIDSKDIAMKLWIDEERLIIEKISFDMKELIKKQHSMDNIDADKITMTYSETYENILLNKDIKDSKFKYIEDENLNLVDSLDDTGTDESGSGNPGEPFIDFKFKPLDEKAVRRLSDYSDKKILLSFINSKEKQSRNFIKMLNEIKDNRAVKNLNIICIDTGRNEKELESLKEKMDIKFILASDFDGGITSKYAIESGLPVVYMISPDKIIRQIYNGYFEGFKNHLLNDIKLMDLAPENKTGSSTFNGGIKRRWNARIKASDFCIYEKTIAVLTPSDNINLVSNNGKVKNIFKISEFHPDNIVCSDDKKNESFILLFKKDLNELYSYKKNGGLNWKTKFKYGISDIALFNIDENLRIAVSFNGPAGPVLIDSDGDEISSALKPEYINMISAGKFEENGSIAAITTNGDSLYILDENSNLIKSRSTKEFYLDFLKALPGENKTYDLFLAGNSNGNKILKFLNGNYSNSRWEIILGNAVSDDVTSISKHPLKDLYAVTTKKGRLNIFNKKGELVGAKKDIGFGAKADWIQIEEAHYLLVTGTIDNGITAYEIEAGE